MIFLVKEIMHEAQCQDYEATAHGLRCRHSAQLSTVLSQLILLLGRELKGRTRLHNDLELIKDHWPSKWPSKACYIQVFPLRRGGRENKLTAARDMSGTRGSASYHQ